MTGLSRNPLSDDKILDSWRTNAAAWTSAIRDEKIESRKLVTNPAVVDTVLSLGPRTALDIGCGEGWLSRELSEAGVRVTGVDAIPALVEAARLKGGGEFVVASYEEIAAGALEIVVDVAVANFALIGKEAVDELVLAMPRLLAPAGHLVIQTLHPVVATGDEPYADGWREGSWAGFGEEFSDPAPWYFRTLETWVGLIAESGLTTSAIREPVHPATGRPASVILIARKPLQS